MGRVLTLTSRSGLVKIVSPLSAECVRVLLDYVSAGFLLSVMLAPSFFHTLYRSSTHSFNQQFLLFSLNLSSAFAPPPLLSPPPHSPPVRPPTLESD